MLRRLAVEREGWLDETEFEDAIAATNLLPGPASTQLAIFCAWRLRGVPGARVGGACFICPGLAVIIGLAAVFLASSPPTWIKGAALGAGAAVAPVAVNAALGLIPASWRRVGRARARRVRWIVYGGSAAWRRRPSGPSSSSSCWGAGWWRSSCRARCDHPRT